MLTGLVLVHAAVLHSIMTASWHSRCTKAHDVVVLTLAQQRNLLPETLLHRRTAVW